VAKDTVAGKEVQAHIYEWVRLLDHANPRYTSQVVVSDSGEVGFGSVPVQMIFCLKEQASVYTSLDSPRLDATR
jgi:chitin synthase